MNNKKSISALVVLIIIMAAAASAYGIFSSHMYNQHEFKSLHGQTVSVYGKGLYHNDSVSVAAQGIAQDIVTLFLGIPLLIISLFLSRKDLLRGKLLLAGTLGYFLYTYISYTFLTMYNSFFLVYVMLMSASFFAFILTMMSFDLSELSLQMSDKLPVNFIGSFIIFCAAAVGLLWIGKLVPPLVNGTVPAELEYYTTMVIQGMDLGFIVPASFLSGILLMKRKPMGYLLSSVIIIKMTTMLTAITAMIISQAMAGVKMGIGEIAMFPVFNAAVIYCLVLVLKSVKSQKDSRLPLKNNSQSGM